VTDLITENGAALGIAGEDSSGTHRFTAPLTIGADGIRSTVANLASEKLDALKRADVDCARAYYYAYLEGIPPAAIDSDVMTEFSDSGGKAHLFSRSDDGQVVVGTAFDAVGMREFRTDLKTNFIANLEGSKVARILADGRIVGKVRSSGLLKNTYRDPVCDGAILLGDSGLHVDPLFGQGHAFALVSEAIFAGLAPQWIRQSDGRAVRADAMREFTRKRDASLMPHYQASVRISRQTAHDSMWLAANRAAAAESWAAEEIARFAHMDDLSARFPSFRLAKLIGRTAARA
jgi:flavin-dependent dehydrogenase